MSVFLLGNIDVESLKSFFIIKAHPKWTQEVRAIDALRQAIKRNLQYKEFDADTFIEKELRCNSHSK